MSRELDVAIAEALGKKVIWIEIIDGYKVKDLEANETEPIMTNVPVIEMENGVIHYTGYSDGGFYVETNLVPKYSSGGDDMLKLDREMRERGWLLGLWLLGLYYDGGLDYAANYNNSERNKKAGWWLAAVIEDTQIADTMPEAVALAAYKALTGREWRDE